MLFGLLTKDNFLNKRLKQAFKYAIIFTILIILAEFGTILASDQGPEFRSIHKLFNVLGFSLTPFVPLILIAIFDPNVLKKYKLLFLPAIINVILSILSLWFNLIFYINLSNAYQRGSWFIFFVLTYFINISILVVVTWQNSKYKFKPIKWKLLGLALFTIVGTGIQVIIPEVYSSWHTVTFALFLLYLLLSEFEGSFDGLTGLNNRFSFEKATKNLTGKKEYSVILIDINDFKEVNDKYGHDYGDIVLKEVSDIIINTFDERSTSYRIGGDEFCIITKDSDEIKLKEKLHLMGKKVETKREESEGFPEMSYGYKINNQNEFIDFIEAFKIADREMYKDKLRQKTIKNNKKL